MAVNIWYAYFLFFLHREPPYVIAFGELSCRRKNKSWNNYETLRRKLKLKNDIVYTNRKYVRTLRLTLYTLTKYI